MSTSITAQDRGITAHSLRGRVDRALAAFLEYQAEQLNDSPSLSEVFRLLREFLLCGGKRLRPLFCYWGWRGAGGRDTDQAIIKAAASLELFQAFALIHDDIIDRSDTRRGNPSMHRALADLHAQSGWRGSSDRFGMSQAILCGDLCLMWADEMFRTCGLPYQRVHAADPALHRMRTEVMIGQKLELADQATGGSLTGALKIIRFKTAKYTIERPLQVGGALAGADPNLLAAYSAFGVPLGEAFQLRDDVLGVFGDGDVTGKSTMDDLREGRPTVLIALTREKATPRQTSEIDAHYGRPDLDHDDSDTLRQIITDTGALARVEEMITRRTARALHALDEAPLTDEARTALQELARISTTRIA